MRSLAISLLALLASLTPSRPASACSQQATCAALYCQGDQAVLEATLRSLPDGDAASEEGTFEVLAAYGAELGLTAGELVTIRVAPYLYDSDVGQRLLVGVTSSPAGLRGTRVMRASDEEFRACVGQSAALDAAAAAALVLAPDCEAQLDAIDGNGELAAREAGTSTPCSCRIAGADRGGLVIAGVVLALGRRRRRARFVTSPRTVR